jgi:hypothetical protein
MNRKITSSGFVDLTEEQVAALSLTAAEVNSQLRESLVSAVQNKLDEFARSRGYDSILSACTYVNSPVAKFSEEAKHCVIVRSNTWNSLFAIFDSVDSGAREMPKQFSDIEDELPELKWPILN